MSEKRYYFGQHESETQKQILDKFDQDFVVLVRHERARSILDSLNSADSKGIDPCKAMGNTAETPYGDTAGRFGHDPLRHVSKDNSELVEISKELAKDLIAVIEDLSCRFEGTIDYDPHAAMNELRAALKESTLGEK